MIEQVRVDYRARQGMIFGDPPNFEAVLDSIHSREMRRSENTAKESGTDTHDWALGYWVAGAEGVISI
jgi:hypothetical protein